MEPDGDGIVVTFTKYGRSRAMGKMTGGGREIFDLDEEMSSSFPFFRVGCTSRTLNFEWQQTLDAHSREMKNANIPSGKRLLWIRFAILWFRLMIRGKPRCCGYCRSAIQVAYSIRKEGLEASCTTTTLSTSNLITTFHCGWLPQSFLMRLFSLVTSKASVENEHGSVAAVLALTFAMP